ncbi:MAG: metal-dependent phosphohydrolase [Okeania sp. SIO2G4]|uniref:Npun_R2479 family HD domain-containing metalloprotein n=1 Tax=unclassified Okeania TaxID=2634635 RepID=UPI0013BE21E4|nr:MULTISPECIES: Npun_R2479 family HD domain-containing metalloprotein [unclassified Okeania]NEP75953.1 metal-dependent phosphohydrolase [Okeania sp. SIO2G5]NEP94504.1 metal-dependent phosphohydrolase [Okeania sp. SIO2F5]NEQ92100.1 metal-dependent phosphohydrolase [Okeania sp. SIO2G4]
MLNATEILINAFVKELQAGYHRTYGGFKPNYPEIIAWAGNMALENIANCDALYHNVEHTMLVTLVGQEILRGKHIREGGVSPEDWLHYIISLLCHDIGYVKGVCRKDQELLSLYATGINDGMVSLADGATSASLTPYHVDRGKLVIDERFGGHRLIDADQIKRNIELTRFPIPKAETHQDRNNFSGLSRAADLIGQLSDPNYLLKIGALFYEFEEVGTNKVLGYESPADLRRSYAKFYWDGVYPYIPAAINYLELTQSGKQIIANLYANVFQVEHEPKEKTNGTKLLDAKNKSYTNGDIPKTTPVNKKKFSEILGLNL